MTNEIKNKIRSYEKRKPITDKRFKFSNDLIKRAAYVGNGKLPDKRSDINTESLQLWIRPNGIKTFYASKKVSMFNKEKVKMELNSTSKKMMRFDLNYEAAKEMLPQILKDMAAPKEETKDDSLFGNLAKDFLKNGINGYRLSDKSEKHEYKDSTKTKYIKLINTYILLKGGKDITQRLVAPMTYKERFYNVPFKDLRIKDITPRQVAALQERMKDTKTLANDVIRVVSIIFTWANTNEKYLGVNPCRSTAKFSEKKIRVKLTDMETQRLMDHCTSKAFDYEPRFLGLIALDLLCGKRGVELFGLRWQPPQNEKELKECSGWLEENWKETHYFYLHDTKNRKPERVHMCDEAVEVINRLERSRFTEANKHFVSSPFLFPQRNDIKKPINSSSISKRMRALNVLFGWTYEYEDKIRNKFTIKIARKTYGSKIAETHGLEIASRKLNHRDMKVTKEHYIVPEDKQLEINNPYGNNVERIDKFKKVK
tara:strand:+ start:742 stop:2193 length:1452 start_codon:yes stop_codon:yes gene_type:complete